ncbi:hypothetical protein [Amycolatopsis echigonensis]|uniref:Uncharacterized protein n=1 Tax=Amycolatopsis echigonensis TaxID=2576905 RepID=A0A2N3WS33_9PSEU|nr:MULTISPECIES: hypothetical protein [Amycolatopsis]MBB2505289.1 hypothetical protein [Amycolatopsis echigonensis]PKV96691.1 hypothetical protein ATK30_7651 [Amycolatopsis niigatensis]
MPTVVVGGQGLVNPSVRQVQAAMREAMPDVPLASDAARRPSPGLLGSLREKVRNLGR